MPTEPKSDVLEVLLSELAELQVTGAICLERIRQELSRSVPGSGGSAAAWPVIEPAGFNVVWKGRTCNLGPGISFQLLARLLRRPNQFASHQDQIGRAHV